jgi:hypothetical protein
MTYLERQEKRNKELLRAMEKLNDNLKEKEKAMKKETRDLVRQINEMLG